MKNFLEFKTEVLKRAKAANACDGEYERAKKALTFEESTKVITDNFDFAVNNKVIDCNLIKLYELDLNKCWLFQNVSISSGYMICDSATVKAWGSATVLWGEEQMTSYFETNQCNDLRLICEEILL